MFLLALAVGLFGVTGCEKKPEEAVTTEAEKAVEEKAKETISAVVIDETRPLREIRGEAADLNDASLRAAAMGYKDQIIAKQDELADLRGKFPKVPGVEEFGKEPLTPEAEISGLTRSISALTERYRIYFDVLKARGGDLSGLGL